MRSTNTRTGFNWRIVIGQLGREEFITMGISFCVFPLDGLGKQVCVN